MHVPLSTHVGLSSLTLGFTLFHPHFDVFAFLLLVSPSFNVVGELQILAMFQFCSLFCLSLVVVPLLQSFFRVCNSTNISISSLLLNLSCALLQVFEKSCGDIFKFFLNDANQGHVVHLKGALQNTAIQL
jgi:hypothetical protein